jgi:hypothetical protein
MEAAAIPFPNPERTPPVTMMYLVAGIFLVKSKEEFIGNCQCGQAKMF